MKYASSTPEWWQDDKSLEAIVFNLAQIGEWVRFVEEDIQHQYTRVNWAAMKGLRNRIINDYDYINPLVIKGIIAHDLPRLVAELECILDEQNFS